MVTLQVFYLAQGLVALGYDDDGELGQALKAGWTGLYLFLLLCLCPTLIRMEVTIKNN